LDYTLQFIEIFCSVFSLTHGVSIACRCYRCLCSSTHSYKCSCKWRNVFARGIIHSRIGNDAIHFRRLWRLIQWHRGNLEFVSFRLSRWQDGIMRNFAEYK